MFEEVKSSPVVEGVSVVVVLGVVFGDVGNFVGLVVVGLVVVGLVVTGLAVVGLAVVGLVVLGLVVVVLVIVVNFCVEVGIEAVVGGALVISTGFPVDVVAGTSKL